jgi:hypothetical protein
MRAGNILQKRHEYIRVGSDGDVLSPPVLQNIPGTHPGATQIASAN